MMNTMNVIVQLVQRMGVACFFVAAVILMGCSSAPESQPEPSKKEVQQDADRFFNKMEQEEGAQSPSQK
jgi:predicted component of type VI protein secretion system